MNYILKIEMIIISLIIIGILLLMLKKKTINVKYSFIWMVTAFLFLIFVIFSDQMIHVARALGFELLSNFIFFLMFGILFVITFSLTVIVANLKNRIIILTQEISTLKSEKEEK